MKSCVCTYVCACLCIHTLAQTGEKVTMDCIVDPKHRGWNLCFGEAWAWEGTGEQGRQAGGIRRELPGLR